MIRPKKKFYAEDFEKFDTIKCLKCKSLFKISKGDTGFCPVCEKKKVYKEQFIEQTISGGIKGGAS